MFDTETTSSFYSSVGVQHDAKRDRRSGALKYDAF